MVIVVLSPPRSGSSMVAGMLHRLGVDMGDRLLAASEHNPAGFFEDRDFLDLHAAMMGDRPPGHPEFAANAFPTPGRAVPPELVGRYAALCRARHEAHGDRPWGVKDPNQAFLWPVFRRVCPCPIRVVTVARRRADAARSLSRMFPGYSLPTSYLYVDHHRFAIGEALRHWHGPRLGLAYEEVLADPARHATLLAAFAGVPPAAEAAGSVDRSLDHGATP